MATMPAVTTTYPTLDEAVNMAQHADSCQQAGGFVVAKLSESQFRYIPGDPTSGNLIGLDSGSGEIVERWKWNGGTFAKLDDNST